MTKLLTAVVSPSASLTVWKQVLNMPILIFIRIRNFVSGKMILVYQTWHCTCFFLYLSLSVLPSCNRLHVNTVPKKKSNSLANPPADVHDVETWGGEHSHLPVRSLWLVHWKVSGCISQLLPHLCFCSVAYIVQRTSP